MSGKKIAITMGDAGGIGPEVAVKAALSEGIQDLCSPYLVGDRRVLEEAADLTGCTLNNIEVIEPFTAASFQKGKATPESGMASYAYIRRAVELCLGGDFHGMVTAPISKDALRMAGLSWPGHTEMLAELTSTDRYAMMLTGGPLSVILVTTHLPLREVPEKLTKDLVAQKIGLAHEAAMMLGIEDPVIAVAGLNPHAGEERLFGNEEADLIEPAVMMAAQNGFSAEGPVPPDVVFRLAYNGSVDIIVAMYHDQGLIPLKMIAFDSGVNVTVGLPVIRTSPDHGTAYDIAWSGTADPGSMVEAIRLSCRLSLH